MWIAFGCNKPLKNEMVHVLLTLFHIICSCLATKSCIKSGYMMIHERTNTKMYRIIFYFIERPSASFIRGTKVPLTVFLCRTLCILSNQFITDPQRIKESTKVHDERKLCTYNRIHRRKNLVPFSSRLVGSSFQFSDWLMGNTTVPFSLKYKRMPQNKYKKRRV